MILQKIGFYKKMGFSKNRFLEKMELKNACFFEKIGFLFKSGGLKTGLFFIKTILSKNGGFIKCENFREKHRIFEVTGFQKKKRQKLVSV